MPTKALQSLLEVFRSKILLERLFYDRLDALTVMRQNKNKVIDVLVLASAIESERLERNLRGRTADVDDFFNLVTIGVDTFQSHLARFTQSKPKPLCLDG